MKSFEHYYILLRRKFIRPIMNNHELSVFIARHCLKMHMKMFYENWLGKRLNLRHPRDINEQLMKLTESGGIQRPDTAQTPRAMCGQISGA